MVMSKIFFMPHSRSAVARILAHGVLLGVGFGMVACGVPPELAEASRTTPTPSPTFSPSATAPPTSAPSATPSGTPTGRSDTVAVACAEGPSGTQVIDLLRRSGLLSAGSSATLTKGPLCAGSWHYTVVQIPGREPLQVVTRTETTGLDLVTAGTDVCSIPVRTSAPTGIRTLVC